jgi:hypothetical protein
MNPRICFLAIACLIAAAESLQAATLELPAATQFTIRHEGANSGEIYSDPFAFSGLIQASPPFLLTDETFFEFDASALAGIANASLTFTISSSAPGNDLLIARTFDISHYAGSGIPDLTRFASGQYIETLAVEAQASYHQSRVKTFSLDVTALLAAAVANNQSHIGFRLHNPVDVTPGSDSVPRLYYQYDSAQLSVVVPEPPSQVLLIGCALAHLAVAANRRVGRCRDV